MSSLFLKGSTVNVNGEVEWGDNLYNVDTQGTIEDWCEGEDKALVTLENVDGDVGVCVFVDKEDISINDDEQKWLSNSSELIKDNVKVSFVYLGEGYDGDYDETDSADEKLLRFDVYKKENEEWVYVDDSSYCTLIPLSTDKDIQMKLLEYIMLFVYEPVMNGYSIKKICENLSHISIDLVEEKKYSLVLEVDKKTVEDIESTLSNADNIIQEALSNGVEEYDIEDTFKDIEIQLKGKFEDDSEVVISVCSANPPYVDGTLFGEGFRVNSEPSENLIGEWIFEYQGVNYEVTVVPK